MSAMPSFDTTSLEDLVALAQAQGLHVEVGEQKRLGLYAYGAAVPSSGSTTVLVVAHHRVQGGVPRFLLEDSAAP